MKRIIGTIFLIVLSALLLAGCSRSRKPLGTVLLYTSVPTDIANEIEAAFESKHPGADLEIYRSGTGEVMERINEEIGAGCIQADVIWVADFTVGEELKAEGQLLKYESPEAEAIIPALRDEDGTYYAARLLNMVVAYNTDLVAERPEGYRDLLKPEYKGKIGMADPAYSGASLYTVATLSQSEEYGWDYFRRLYGSGAQIVEGNADLIAAIAKGDLWLGITIDFMVRGKKVEDVTLPIDYVVPAGGAVLVPSPIAITKDSRNIPAAQAFVDFILSREGQELMVAQGIAPVRLDVKPPAGIPTITQMEIIPSQPEEIQSHKEDTKRIFAELFQGKEVEGTKERTITLYTSVPIAIIEELRVDFEAQNPGMYLEIYRAGTTQVVEKVNAEIAAGRVQADLLWVADFSVGEDLKGEGVLLPYTPPEAVEIPNVLKDEDGYYFAGRLLNMVVAYNTNSVGETPTGYSDLLDPRYKGRIGHATPETSGAFLYFMGTVLQDDDFGEEFFRELRRHEPSIQTNTQTTQKIADGELDMGITIDFTVRKLLKENPDAPIDYIYPEAGVVMVPSPIAIFKSSRYIEGAMVFERYILSKSGQTLLRDLGGFVPVRLDVNPPEKITSITQLRVIPSDKRWIQEHRAEITAKFIEIFGRQE
jgi:iron(III) transport system substrate-binding protein